MRSELGNLARRFFAHVNGDRDHADEGATEDERDQPRGNMTDAQRLVERQKAVHRRRGVQKDFCDPRHQDENENENVIAFQAPADCLELADFETGQNQIFAHQFFPFALQKIAIFHHYRDQEMRFQHADACAKGIVKAIAPCLDPEHDPNDCEIEKEDDVGHSRVGERDGDDGSAAGNRPIRCHVEPLAPDHDPPHFAAVKMRHRIDVARVVKASLKGDRPLLAPAGCRIFVCHRHGVKWITAR